MRIPRLLTILGPAAVLYVLAARASSDVATSPEWIVATMSLVLSFTPLAVLGSRSERRGSSRLALMGVGMALAIASVGGGSVALNRTHDAAWLVVAVLALDLVVPTGTRPSVRYTALAAVGVLASAAAFLGAHGVLPVSGVGVVVVATLLVTGALHQVVLSDRGHSVEGALSGVALAGIGVALAYAWFGSFEPGLTVTLEFAAALLLWLGHLAWLDPGWRSLRRIGVPAAIASAVCYGLVVAFAPDARLERWELGVFVLAAAILWWAIFAAARRLSNRAVWSTSGRLADGAEAARRRLAGCVSIDDIATAALVPLRGAFDDVGEGPELRTLEPSLRIRVDAGGRANVKPAEIPTSISRALFVDGRQGALDLVSLRTRVIREPAVRELVDAMERGGAGAVVPCVHIDHTEGLLFLPLAERAETLSRIELEELGRLAEALGGSLASALAQRRADTHIHQLSTERRAAEDRISVLEGELEQLRGQCDLLGRGLAEDRALHVAYSQSMRRVQTRAIELAPRSDPVLVVAPAGSPVLPVSRFIHDRGPRWKAPFVVADCSAAPADRVSDLLFGSEARGRGGWLHSATGGTLLLRDLPALARPDQVRLLDALRALDRDDEPTDDSQVARPRLIATSRAPLRELERRGAIDPELARVLAGPALTIPPLRERREDVPSLTLLGIDRACRVLACDPVGITEEAMTDLVDHDWPGDVAELERVLELAVSRATRKMITRADLPPLAWPAGEDDASLDGTYVEVEKRLLLRALRRSGGNKSEAARVLGLKRTTFLDKLRRHGLEQAAPQGLGGSAVG